MPSVMWGHQSGRNAPCQGCQWCPMGDKSHREWTSPIRPGAAAYAVYFIHINRCVLHLHVHIHNPQCCDLRFECSHVMLMHALPFFSLSLPLHDAFYIKGLMLTADSAKVKRLCWSWLQQNRGGAGCWVCRLWWSTSLQVFMHLNRREV